jgi:hypothetical protein
MARTYAGTVIEAHADPTCAAGRGGASAARGNGTVGA